MKRSSLKNTGLLSEKFFALTLWVVKLAKDLQGEKAFVLSKYALGF